MYIHTYVIYIANTSVSKDILLLARNNGMSTPWLTGVLREMFLNS